MINLKNILIYIFYFATILTLTGQEMQKGFYTINADTVYGSFNLDRLDIQIVTFSPNNKNQKRKISPKEVTKIVCEDGNLVLSYKIPLDTLKRSVFVKRIHVAGDLELYEGYLLNQDQVFFIKDTKGSNHGLKRVNSQNPNTTFLTLYPDCIGIRSRQFTFDKQSLINAITIANECLNPSYLKPKNTVKFAIGINTSYMFFAPKVSNWLGGSYSSKSIFTPSVNLRFNIGKKVSIVGGFMWYERNFTATDEVFTNFSHPDFNRGYTFDYKASPRIFNKFYEVPVIFKYYLSKSYAKKFYTAIGGGFSIVGFRGISITDDYTTPYKINKGIDPTYPQPTKIPNLKALYEGKYRGNNIVVQYNTAFTIGRKIKEHSSLELNLIYAMGKERYYAHIYPHTFDQPKDWDIQEKVVVVNNNRFIFNLGYFYEF